MWDLLLEVHFRWLLGSRGGDGQGQSGYLHLYPFLLLLRDAGATGLAVVLCPRGNTPLLQQGEPDTHGQHQESHSGTRGEGNGGRKENREQSYPSCTLECPATVHTGIQVCCPKEARQAGDKGTPRAWLNEL